MKPFEKNVSQKTPEQVKPKQQPDNELKAKELLTLRDEAERILADGIGPAKDGVYPLDEHDHDGNYIGPK